MSNQECDQERKQFDEWRERFINETGFPPNEADAWQARAALAQQAVPELTSREVNDACWAFIEAMPHQLPGPIWNDLKPAIYAAICKYIAAAPAAPQASQGAAVGAEPVAKVVSWTNGSYWRNYKLTWMEGGDYLDTGALLYATPPDHTAAMRQALEALVGNCTNPAADPEQAAAEDAAIAKLRAALGESKPPVQGSQQ